MRLDYCRICGSKVHLVKTPDKDYCDDYSEQYGKPYEGRGYQVCCELCARATDIFEKKSDAICDWNKINREEQ